MKVLGWYVVDRNGGAMCCVDEGDAKQNMREASKLYPESKPHRAVLLAEIEEADVATETNNP